ncbi:MAG: outer membrane beta-barrel protein [Roseivirga sp.]
MRKAIIALGSVCMLFAAASVKAQEQPLRFGLEGGLSASRIMWLDEMKIEDKKTENSTRIWGSGGAFVSYAFHEYIGIKSGVYYAGLGDTASQKKEKEEKETSSKKKFSLSTNHILVPVAVSIFPMGHDPEEGIFNMDLGVQAQFPLGAEVEGEGDMKSKFKKEFLNMFDLGIIAAIGYEFPIGLTIENKYSFGLMGIFKREGDGDGSSKGYVETTLGLQEKKPTNLLSTLTVGYNFARLLED